MSVTLTNCNNCGNEFTAKRSTARFCSTKCRVYAKRGATPTEKILYYPNATTPEKIKEILQTKQPEQKYCTHGFPANGWSCKKGCK